MPDHTDAIATEQPWRGRAAPDFLIPLRGGGLATFYERFCGEPVAVVFAAGRDDLDGCLGLANHVRVVAVTSGADMQWRNVSGLVQVADDGSIARAFLGRDRVEGAVAVVLGPTLTIAALVEPLSAPGIRQIVEAMPLAAPRTTDSAAPVLMVPEVLPRSLCQRLIAAHDADNFESGMLRERDGRIDLVPDPTAQCRRDHRLADAGLVEAVTAALEERVLPVIARAFHYGVTRLESYKVVAYDASGGYFRLHRDNVTPDARHRRFALSLNLNAEYEGGELVFPEFGPTRYRPPPGGAMVFSGTLLHGVRDVTAGRRYVLLSFLWGDEPA
jgi:predicted 2-oxoglutarate/Fe(II)-dependent dioxygenase YbiX